jgi:hypothetical protein
MNLDHKAIVTRDRDIHGPSIIEFFTRHGVRNRGVLSGNMAPGSIYYVDNNVIRTMDANGKNSLGFPTPLDKLTFIDTNYTGEDEKLDFSEEVLDLYERMLADKQSLVNAASALHTKNRNLFNQ